MTAKEQRKAAEDFAAKWLGRGYEKGECQKFWIYDKHAPEMKPVKVVLRDRLAQLFRLLNTEYADRDPEDIPDLLDFPYVGSGLFDDESIRIPRFTDETRALLLDCLCADLDWTEINPTIFGAVFESTLSTAMRRRNGMHYTTVRNIHRVADPLFLWDLEKEFDGISALGNVRRRNEALLAFQEKLGSLKFLDPACGSGNFLTETYISLRRLENRAIALRQRGQGELDLGETIRVTIDQFFGIEIDGFAVSVAQTALWIAESQMMAETEEILHRRIDFLPLRRYAHIVKANALRTDWNSLLKEGEHFDYILGNPPFVGKKEQSREQKQDLLATFVDIDGRPLKTAGKIDYVCAWYWKAAALAACCQHPVRCCFVSTNSICQGEQVAAVWKPLKERLHLDIDFAWRTFVWNSEANEKAHVHVVIVGFHAGPEWPKLNRDVGLTTKNLFYDDGRVVKAGNINGYLMDGPDVFVDARTRPLSPVPSMNYGSMPIDSGHLILDQDTRAAILSESPQCAQYIREYVGGEELLNNRKRWACGLLVLPRISFAARR